jgi:hypothetical protein
LLFGDIDRLVKVFGVFTVTDKTGHDKDFIKGIPIFT